MAESVDAPDLKSVGSKSRGSSSLPTRIFQNSYEKTSSSTQRIYNSSFYSFGEGSSN